MREYKIGDRVEVIKEVKFLTHYKSHPFEHDFRGLEGTIVEIDLDDLENHRVKLDNLPKMYTHPKHTGGIWFTDSQTVHIEEVK